MYSWDGDTSDWYGRKGYAYSDRTATKRESDAKRAKAHGPRTYEKKQGPKEKVTDPRKHIQATTPNPLIIAVDVTGSMAHWPFEIFDRLPLLYNTLSQYREDLEISFVAIGDAKYDKWPLQATPFANGFDLEQMLGALYGEGGGGDAPESYGLFAYWVATHVTIQPTEERPFLIVFGDAPMHPKVTRGEIEHYLDDSVNGDIDSFKAWEQVAQTWNTWFLRRPTGKPGDAVDKQWSRAIGEQKIFHIEDEQRAVDYAMGLISRAWGYFGDFEDNMRARHSEEVVVSVSQPIEMKCPTCGGPIPTDATAGMLTCKFCGITIKL